MEDEDPPPPPPPMALPDELVEEVLLRSPPDDPARLVRAALVCKRWSRLVSARAFRRRFRDFHLQRRGAPMLGFLHNVSGAKEALHARLVRTSASCPPLDTKRGWHALDARGGRVLLYRTDQYAGGVLFNRRDAAFPGIRLAVWDPLSTAAGGGHLELPVPTLPRFLRCWNAALLCCDRNGLQDDAGESFRIVLVGTDAEGTFACVYSALGPAAWSEPIYTAQQPALRVACVDAVRGALVRNAFYFLFQGRTSILKYDLATGDVSMIQLPPASNGGRMSHTMLTITEDGGLGFARVEGFKLCLWSMEPRPNGGALAVEWTQGRVIDLRSLHPGIDLLGFADGIGMILMGNIDGFFSADQKSGRIDKLVDGPGFYRDIVPYMSFYTPDTWGKLLNASLARTIRMSRISISDSKFMTHSVRGKNNEFITISYLTGSSDIHVADRWIWGLTIDIIFGQVWNLSSTYEDQKSHCLHEILPSG